MPPANLVSSAWVPFSTMFPSFMTWIMSELRMVPSRCAMATLVSGSPSMPALLILSSVSWIMASLSASSALVASSRNKTFGLRRSARAMAMRCFWPPENCEPPEPTKVFKPSGKFETKVTCAASSAF
mmetsp:Transcript_57305/g.112829  ORF Transcript_57305/g.112829 Transcript_57305/m.112829 type:complete len:127 (-) Transcript_57305:121-501(-)